MRYSQSSIRCQSKKIPVKIFQINKIPGTSLVTFLNDHLRVRVAKIRGSRKDKVPLALNAILPYALVETLTTFARHRVF